MIGLFRYISALYTGVGFILTSPIKNISDPAAVPLLDCFIYRQHSCPLHIDGENELVLDYEFTTF